MFPSTFTAAAFFLVWGAVFYFNWMAAALLMPLFACGLLFALLAPRFEPEKLAELKGAAATLPAGRRAVDLGGEAQPPWKYRCGGSRRRHRVVVPGDLGGVFGLSWKRRRHFYSREVELPDGAATGAAGNRVFLCFEGVGGAFRVAVDGKRAGRGAAFAPAEFEITDLVKNKRKFNLSVSLTDAHGANSPLHPGRVGFAFAKGIFRGVRMELRPPAFIAGATLNDTNDGGGEVEVSLDGASEHPTALSVACLGAGGETLFERAEVVPPFTGGKKIRLSLPKEAVPEWSPDKPGRHSLVVRTASGPLRDERVFPFGKNAVRWRGDGAVIGGKTRKPLGVAWMEFLPPYGASIPAWATQRDVRTIREAGFDFIWVDQFPPSEALLEACDREGLLVAGDACAPRGDAPPHPCLMPLSEVEIIRRVVTPNPAGLKLPQPRPKTGKPAILLIEHFDGSLAADSRRVRDHRRAAFDLEFIKALPAMPVAGAVLGSLIYWGYRIGLLAETRRPTFTHQAISNQLKKGVTMPINIERPLPPPPFLLPALAAALLALAVPACKPFVEKLFTHPHAALSFTHPWESLLMRLAIAAAATLAVCNRLHSHPLRALNALAPLPLFLSRPMIRKRNTRLIVIFLAMLYVWFAGTCLCSVAVGKSFAATLPSTAQAGIVELLLLLLLLPGAPAAPVTLGAGAAALLYLLQMVPPAGAAAYGAFFAATMTMLLKRI